MGLGLEKVVRALLRGGCWCLVGFHPHVDPWDKSHLVMWCPQAWEPQPALVAGPAGLSPRAVVSM